uniref:Uncharacterized protein n=1 Tax=Brassica oleracea TaxID=3712 RepID=A0A3P6E0P1_BRAOL|nr:unnamed protein product [Brassica oleracea]
MYLRSSRRIWLLVARSGSLESRRGFLAGGLSVGSVFRVCGRRSGSFLRFRLVC